MIEPPTSVRLQLQYLIYQHVTRRQAAQLPAAAIPLCEECYDTLVVERTHSLFPVKIIPTHFCGVPVVAVFDQVEACVGCIETAAAMRRLRPEEAENA